MTATVASANATGTVEFYDGSSLLGSGTLSAGVATLQTAALTGGSHPALTARYVGNANYLASTSLAVAATVSTVATTTVASASTTTPSYGDVVTLLATVTTLLSPLSNTTGKPELAVAASVNVLFGA
jgi:hypothetical protein